MKVIKVKVKTIILAIFLFFITIPYVFYAIGVSGFSTMNTQKKTVGIYTVGFLKLYDAWPTIKFNEGKNYFMIAMSNYNYILEKGETSYTGSVRFYDDKQGNMEQADISREYFLKGIELGEEDNSYINNLNGLINLEMTLGNTEIAKEYIAKAIDSEKEDISLMGKVNQMVYEAKSGNYDKALDIANTYKEQYGFFNGYIDVIKYLKGDLDEIKKNDLEYFTSYESPDVLKVVENNKVKKSYEYLNYIDFYSRVIKYDVEEEYQEDDIEFAEVSGKVLLKGKPLANVAVNLEIDGSYRTSALGKSIQLYGISNADYIVAYTNEEGEFTFKNAYPNIKYDIRVLVPSAIRENTSTGYNDGIVLTEGEKVNVNFEIEEAINITDIKTDYEKDEIIIKYDKIPEAKSYGIRINVKGYGFNYAEITASDEIRIPLTNGALQCANLWGYDEDSKGNAVLVPEGYLGYYNHNEGYINVLAYDEDGKIIRESFSNEKISFKKKNLNRGEKLIVDGKIDEGQKWLEEKLKEDPNNKEYMYPLMRIAFEKGDKDTCIELNNRIEAINKTGLDKSQNEWFEFYLDLKGQN